MYWLHRAIARNNFLIYGAVPDMNIKIFTMNFLRDFVVPPPGVSPSERRFYVFSNYIFLFSFFGHLSYIPVFYYLGNDVVFVNNLACIALDLFCLYLNFHGHGRAASLLWVLEVAYHAGYSIIAFGWDYGFDYYFLGLTVFVFFSQWHIAVRAGITLLLGTTAALLYWYSGMYAPLTAIEHTPFNVFHLINICVNIAALGYAAMYYGKLADKTEDELRFKATHDRLTGVLNRGAVLDCLRNEMVRAVRSSDQIGIIMCDIDHFKQINDRYGHVAGDRVLHDVAQQIQSSLRPYDMVGRYGGEEFLILLPGCDMQRAYRTANRLVFQVRSHVTEYNGEDITVTISTGVTSFIAAVYNEIDEVDIVQLADNALYLAKRNGRNRVEMSMVN